MFEKSGQSCLIFALSELIEILPALKALIITPHTPFPVGM